MSRMDAAIEEPYRARVVHRSVVFERAGLQSVVKLMLNLAPAGGVFEAGKDIGFLGSDLGAASGDDGLRVYTIEAVGEVPFEKSIDVTLYVRVPRRAPDSSIARRLAGLQQGEQVRVYGPFAYPFYPPTGSRSNLILIGAGCGMVPFRWLAQRIQQRRFDWMGKVLMLEGPETGLEHLYLNKHDADQDQYFDLTTRRAFDALKTRYSATALDHPPSAAANRDALWRLLGQGRVFVYLAGYRGVAEAMDDAMERHLRLPGRWQQAKSALVRDGHWLEYLYD